ncbi:arabinose 5-phosphate isomerase [Enterobacter cloacae]|uniref:Arabinose 5-phosphate isomerase n=1 Tax=Enterobacter cloacae TaxID=550 RepID=A0A377LU03_ENTCL|nr:arabinose 5-phosphate isomerase [Enterobacter cloacae]
MSQIELQPGFDFQKAGKDVLEIEREGLAQLDQYINQDFSLPVRRCSTVSVKSW